MGYGLHSQIEVKTEMGCRPYPMMKIQKQPTEEVWMRHAALGFSFGAPLKCQVYQKYFETGPLAVAAAFWPRGLFMECFVYYTSMLLFGKCWFVIFRVAFEVFKI